MAIIRMQDVRAQVQANAGAVTGEGKRFTWAIDQKDSDKVHVHLQDYARLGMCVPVSDDVRAAVKSMRGLDPDLSFPMNVARSLWHAVGDALTDDALVEFVCQMATCASVTVKESEEDKRADRRLANSQPAGPSAVCDELAEWYKGRKAADVKRLRDVRISALMATGMTREEAEAILPEA